VLCPHNTLIGAGKKNRESYFVVGAAGAAGATGAGIDDAGAAGTAALFFGTIVTDMATMIAVIATDAHISAEDLNRTFRRVVDRTFNALSIDTDTSTSDMAVVLASGIAGPIDDLQFETALSDVCLNLTRQLAADGEGAETRIVVDVGSARDDDQARRVAKAVVNSPLVKTAIHGRDPCHVSNYAQVNRFKSALASING